MTPELKKAMDEVAAVSKPSELAADLSAAGYNDQDIQSYLAPALQPTSWSAEQDRDRQGNAPSETLAEYKPTWRDSLRTNIETLGEKAGVPNPEDLARDIAGDAFSMGLVDITPASIPLGIQEGVNQAAAGYRTGDKTDMALGALNAGLNVAAAIPGAKAVTKGLDKVSEKLLRNYDPNVLGSNFGNVASATKSKVFELPIFSTGDIPLKPGAASVAEFYSPVVETIRNAEFPSKGYKGSELMKLLQDKTPGVRKAELDVMDLGIDPQKRYTKEEVLGLAEQRSYKVTAEVQDNDIFKLDQRQDLRDPEVDYSTLKINATPVSAENPAFLPRMGKTHYDPETIAHTRVSVRSGQDGSEYLLVEEIQSDLLQKGFIKPRGAISRDAAYDEVLEGVSEGILADSKFANTYSANKEFFDNYFKLSSESSRLNNLRQTGAEIPEADSQALEALLKKTQDLFEVASSKGDVDDKFNTLYNNLDNAGWEEGTRIDRRMQPVGKPPITEDSDAVRLSLQSAMAKAADSDVTSLVIPNVERIVAARARPGSKEFAQYLEPNSGFQRTYTKGVDKFVKQLQAKYGDAIKVDIVELPYTKQVHYYEGKEIQLPTTALRIDFSGVKDVDFRVSRFAEGGMVEDNQMNRLMAEGGITDDGMNIEPVTGNEVPPGSLSKEVRDDIPAKLSEGEYVVPADVVRFFGVKFFEDLRMQAKQGLSEMDADGRIGGATVDANGVPVEGQDEELTPEEEQMLMEALGTSGMAEGGMTERNPAFGAKTFDRSTFSMPKNGGFESRMYYNPATKEKKSFQFMNGNPIGVIPAGFVPYTEGMETQAPVAPTTAPKVPDTNEAIPSTPNTNSGGTGTIPTATGTGTGSGGINYQAWADKNKEAIMADPYQFGVNALADTSGKNLSKGLGVAGMATANPLLLGGSVVSKNFNKVQNIAEANAALKVMESKGMVETPQYKQLQKQIESATSDLPLITELAVKNDVAGTGDSYFKALTKGTTPTTMTRTPAKPGLATPTPAPVKTSVGVTSTPLPTSRSDSGASSTFKATTAQTQKSKDISSGKTAAAGKSYTSKGGYTSGRAEGGLVKKGAKAKSKGLASK